MRHPNLFVLLLSALCFVACENTSRNASEEISKTIINIEPVHSSDSIRLINIDTLFGCFRGKGIDTLIFEHTDSVTWRLYSRSGNMTPLKIDYAWGLHVVYEGDLDGNGTDEFGIRREQIMGTWQDYNVFTYIDGKWCYLIPSTVLFNPHFYGDLNYGQKVVNPTNKKGSVQVYYSWVNDCFFLTDTIIKVNPIPVELCDTIPMIERGHKR